MKTYSARGWCMVIAMLACFYSEALGKSPARHFDAYDLTPQQQEAGYAKDGPLAKADSDLAVLYSAYASHVQRGRHRSAFTPSNPLLPVTAGWVVIDAVASGDVKALGADLAALGMRHIATAGRIVSGQFPISALADLAALETLQFARPAYVIAAPGAVQHFAQPADVIADAGGVTSQGDVAMRADAARATFGVDGTGVTVGIISDSFNCLGGADDDVANGDLPPGVVVLAEHQDCSGIGGSDEGRAMMQIVHDVAPGASLVFHSGAGGQAHCAAAILALADAGADVIVDDLYCGIAPMFQDGIVAQTVDQVVRRGVAYFTSAGNEGRDAYQSPFRPSGLTVTIGGTPVGEAHDVDPGPAVDIFQRLTIPAGTSAGVLLQWDAPFFSVSGPPGSPNDLNIYLLNDPPTTVLAQSITSNLGGDAATYLTYTNLTGSGATTFNILIVRFAGPNPGLIKYVLLPFGGTIHEFHTRSSTVFGHSNAAGTATVGAAFFGATPAFGVHPAQLWEYSSVGSTPILFNTAGQRLLRAEKRQKPDLVAPTGVNNTVWGDDIASDPDPYPNFFGTSAAAPHVAAVAALMLQADPSLSPHTIYTILKSTAADMRRPGFDFASGFGLIQADRALQAVSRTPVTCQGLTATIVGTPGPDVIYGTPGRDIIQGRGGNDVIRGLDGDDVLCGGPGRDVLYGGPGDDRLDGEDNMDFCDGGSPANEETAVNCEITVQGTRRWHGRH